MCVPALVVAEIGRTYERTLAELLKEMEKPRATAGRLSPRLQKRLAQAVDPVGEVRTYRRFLEKTLRELDARILVTPDVSHEDIVARDLSGTRPFKGTGTGYRDYLIWHSVLALVAETDEPVAFITENHRDFADAKHEGFHADLVHDLKLRRRSADSVKLFLSLRAFISAVVVPSLEHPERIRRQLQDDSFPGFSLQKWIYSHLHEVLDPRMFADTQDVAGRGLAFFVAPVTTLRTMLLRSVTIVDESNLRIEAEAEIDTDLYVESSWEDYAREGEAQRFWGHQDPSDGDLLCYMKSSAIVTFVMVLGSQSLEVETVDVAEIHGPYEHRLAKRPPN